jgi:putative ABC transport system permease protein
MRLVPLSYNARSLLVRKSATLLTVVSVGATVAVLSGVLALQQGFETLFAEAGRRDVAVFLRPGAIGEGESAFAPNRARQLIKQTNEIDVNADGLPLASAELFLALRLRKLDGGETNVPIRGVQPMTFAIRGDELRVVEGQRFRRGADEVIVGEKLTRRIQGCEVGQVIQLNTTPFKVVGVFESDGPFSSEIWGDLDRLAAALERPVYNRIIARMKPGVDLEQLAERMEDDPEVPAKVMDERAYLSAQTSALSGILRGLGFFLATIMGIAAVFTATNTMQAALAARSHEIGVLISLGFRPVPVFLSFLFESLLLGLLGGAVGALVTLPLNGIETGTTNFQTFTEVAFAFRITPEVLATAILFALVLGLLGGALPAWQAARLAPVEALRRR